MKRILTTKSNSSKLVRRVFHKKSFKDSINNLHTTEHSKYHNDREKEKINALKKQIEELKERVNYLEKDSDTKERAIATLVRDKEQLGSELRRERRSTSKLRQQLEDERDFYFKEKQTYCQEMNDYKRNKRKLLLNSTNKEDKLLIENLKEENFKLRVSFEEAVQSNYNLCVKFLRMKKTKDDLSQRFQRCQDDHSKTLENLSLKLNNARDELEIVVSEQFQKPLSLSHKKFLEIVKRNSQLIHENLCLKIQLEELTNEIEGFKAVQVKKETKFKYPYLIKESKSNAIEMNKNNNGCGDFIVPPLRVPPISDSKSTFKIESIESSKTDTPNEISSKNTELSNYPVVSKSKTELIKQDSETNSSLTSTSSSLSVRTQSAPAILQIKDFRQVATTATQTSLHKTDTL